MARNTTDFELDDQPALIPGIDLGKPLNTVPLAAIVANNGALKVVPEAGYVINPDGGNDPAFAATYQAIAKAFGRDDIAIGSKNGAASIAQTMRDHVNANGPDDLFLLDHGFNGGLANFHYRDLFSKLPGGVNVYVDSCHSGSALRDVNELPAGAMVFTAVGAKSLSRGTDSADATYASQTATDDITPAELYKNQLATADYVYFSEANGRYNQRNNDTITTDVREIVPTKFGISGYPPDGVVDLTKHFEAFKGRHDLTYIAWRDLKITGNINDAARESEMMEVAKALADGKPIPPEHLGMASALAFQHLETSGELAKMIEQAKQNNASLAAGTGVASDPSAPPLNSGTISAPASPPASPPNAVATPAPVSPPAPPPNAGTIPGTVSPPAPPPNAGTIPGTVSPPTPPPNAGASPSPSQQPAAPPVNVVPPIKPSVTAQPDPDAPIPKDKPSATNAAPNSPSPDLSEIEAVVKQGGLLSKRHGTQHQSAIKELQSFLHDQGYKGTDGGDLKIDGIFGGNTAAALKQFQKDQGLKSDGLLGSKTFDSMKNTSPHRQKQQAAIDTSVNDALKEMKTDIAMSDVESISKPYVPLGLDKQDKQIG